MAIRVKYSIMTIMNAPLRGNFWMLPTEFSVS